MPAKRWMKYGEVRRAEFFRKGGAARDLVRGKRWLDRSKRRQLNALFALNGGILKAYLLKESLSQLWNYTYEGAMLRYLQSWIDQLRWQRLKPMEKLARMLLDHLEGILNYCRTKVPMGVIEAVNGRGKYMMHVVTNYSNSGVAQSEGFADQAKTIASAWVYVNSGCVGIGTGNAAYTVGMDEITCETGTWVQFKVPNSGSQANTFVIYAYLNTGADFYVDNAKVVAAP